MGRGNGDVARLRATSTTILRAPFPGIAPGAPQRRRAREAPSPRMAEPSSTKLDGSGTAAPSVRATTHGSLPPIEGESVCHSMALSPTPAYELLVARS